MLSMFSRNTRKNGKTKKNRNTINSCVKTQQKKILLERSMYVRLEEWEEFGKTSSLYYKMKSFIFFSWRAIALLLRLINWNNLLLYNNNNSKTNIGKGKTRQGLIETLVMAKQQYPNLHTYWNLENCKLKWR